ncbi:MAG: TPM domain-containing protein [Verrucomicrobiota bacterium]
MECPYCGGELSEFLPQCPHCGIDLTRLDAVMGAVPRLSPDITDSAQILTAPVRRRLLASIHRFHRSFPQIRLSMVTVSETPNVSLRTYAFWIFNRSAFGSGFSKGPKNRHILLALHSGSNEAALMVGYGLEPFVGRRHLDAILQEQIPHFSRGAWGEGLEGTVQLLEQTLVEIWSAIDQTYGVSIRQIYHEDAHGEEL